MTFPRALAALLLFVAPLAGLPAAAEPSAPAPRRLTVGFHLGSIPEIDERAERFTAICYLRLRWQDPAHAVAGGKRQVFLADAAHAKADELGRPGISFVNETSAAEVKHAVLTLWPDGTVEYDRQFEATLRSEFDLRSFPFDRQELQIQLESFAFPASELVLVPDPQQIKGTRLRLPQWDIGALRWSVAEVEQELEREKYSRLTVSLELTRKPGFYVWQVFVPLFILILIASTVFFLPASDLSDRISVITTSLLTAVALSYAVRTDLPKISYLTTIDRLFVTTYVFFGAKIAGMLIIRHWVDRDAAQAEKIDRVSRWVFPTVYLATNAALILLNAS